MRCMSRTHGCLLSISSHETNGLGRKDAGAARHGDRGRLARRDHAQPALAAGRANHRAHHRGPARRLRPLHQQVHHRRHLRHRAGGRDVRVRDPLFRHHDGRGHARPDHQPHPAYRRHTADADRGRDRPSRPAYPSRRLGRGLLPRHHSGDAAALRGARHGPPDSRLRRVARCRRQLPALDRPDLARLRRTQDPGDGDLPADDRGPDRRAGVRVRGRLVAWQAGGAPARPLRPKRPDGAGCDRQTPDAGGSGAAPAAPVPRQSAAHSRHHDSHDRRLGRSGGHVHGRRRPGADHQLPERRRSNGRGSTRTPKPRC